MIGQIMGGVIFYILISPLFLYIAEASLEYYVAKDQISIKAIEIYLARLSYPLDRIYADLDNPLGLSKNPMEYVQNASYSRSLGNRIILMTLPIIFIIAGVIGQIRLHQLRADYILLEVLVGFSFYRAWRFGHKLMDIEASIQQQ